MVTRLLAVNLAIAVLTAAPTVAQDSEAIAGALKKLEWRHIGPVNMGGRVSDIVGIPGDPRTFWFGGADGGVFKTTNGGTTFEGQWQDEKSYSVGALAVAPSDHNVIWLGSIPETQSRTASACGGPPTVGARGLTWGWMIRSVSDVSPSTHEILTWR
jgi:hypothetical protein